jgi:hypothetical protein
LEIAPGNEIQPIATTLAETQVGYVSDINLYNLIDILIERKEIDLYYYLLNQVAIVKFSDGILEISAGSAGNNRDYNIRLENIISTLSGKQTKIIISKEPGLTLKKKLIQNIENSKLWTNLNASFPGCEILDIIHKNG